MELAAVNAEVVILLREIKELLQIREAREEKLSDPNPKPADEVSADADKNIWAAKQSKVSSGERVDDQVADAAQTVPLEVEVEEDEVIVEGVGSRSPPWNRYDATTPYLPLDSIRHSIGLHSAVIYRQPIKSALEPQWHPGNSWSYWRPIFSVVEDASNEREMTVNCLREGNGYPDYLPEWEIWQENGQWWHIDGACLGPIIEGASDDEGRGSEYALSSSSSGIERAWEWQIRRVVPYSMTPSWNIYFNGEENRESRPSITRITEKCDILDASLGSLYSAPPDWRIHLAFEKDMLRTADRKGKLESYLSEIHEFLTNLHQQGNMQIIDLDDFRMMQCYEWRPPISNVTWSKLDDPRVLARCALEGEHLTLKVPPTVCTLYDAGKRFPKRILGLSQVSWYRIISFRGLASSVRATSSVVYQHQISVDKFCDLMFRDAVSNGGSGANLSELRQVIDLHIRCKSRTKGSNPFVSEWEPFHITWFSIVPDDQERSSAGDWRSGPLYGWSSQMGPRRYHMQEMAFTMGYWPNQIYGSKSRRKPSEYLQPANWHWTILHLAPSHFSQFSETSQRYVFERDGHILPIGLILEAITHAASSWNGIADHLASMITKGDALFDPNKHDGLLFDDSTFSRSRLYFWAIDCLDLFIPSVEANIREWEHFWDAREHLLTAGERLINEFRNHGEKYGDKIHYYTVFPGVEHPLVLVKDQISRLKGTLARLESLRDQLRTLRDGLFNASAVIESRAATELGENVKLLTYVSIFYLPLSFCATLWSIDFSYHPVVFTLVMVLLSIATYLLVMNVNNIVRLGKRIYRRFRSRVVQSMANDPNWVAVGQAFSQFRPERDNTIPSEWKILVFMGSRLWQWVKSLRLRSHSKGDPKAANV